MHIIAILESQSTNSLFHVFLTRKNEDDDYKPKQERPVQPADAIRQDLISSVLYQKGNFGASSPYDFHVEHTIVIGKTVKLDSLEMALDAFMKTISPGKYTLVKITNITNVEYEILWKDKILK